YLWQEISNHRSSIARLVNNIESNYKYWIIKKECYKVVKIFKIKQPKNYKLLDIGCGKGERLKFFKDLGFSVLGLEVSDTVDYAREHFNLEIIKKDIYQADFEDNSFDIVTLFNVLEHIHNPNKLLKEIYRILKDNGFLVIQIPNTDSLQFKIFKKRWITFDIPRDLFYFNIKQLKYLLERQRFNLIKISFNDSFFHPSICMASLFTNFDPQLIWLDERKNKKDNFLKRLFWPLGVCIILPLLILEVIFKKSGMVTLYIKK
ncbi:MAG: class I SAM-dependent methyltransferase, partial [Candidatus Omnitrophica bacterium]|nr:class I SAM-dependent methyltransferase [Candidatus Omnitrophota bacterium]